MTDQPYRTLRILPFNRAAGSYQLGATEAVIEAVGNGDAPPTLRMYSWSHDAIILGIGQPSSQIDVDASRAANCDVLRRISGGTAVFHDEQTVSFQLVLPENHPFLSRDVHVNYQRIASIIVSMLGSFGVPSRPASLEEAKADSPPVGLEAICFSSLSPYEVVSGGRKLVGLSQVRRRTVSALQGMLYLRNCPAKSAQLVPVDPATRERLTSILADRTIDLITAAGKQVTAEEVARHFACSTLETLQVQGVEAPLTSGELQRAEELEQQRYANPDWTFRR